MSLIANALARLADIFGSNQLSNRNYIVDGAKESGSGTTQSIASGYSLCSMFLTAPGLSTVGTYNRGVASAGPVGRLGWPRAGANFSSYIVTTPSTGTLAARTGPSQFVRIEDVNLLESGSFTFSVWLSNLGASPVTISQISVAQGFGTGGSPSANVITLVPVNWVLPVGGWARYSARLDVPSIAGKTIGTGGNQTTWTQIEIDYPVGVNFSIGDSFWQLEYCDPGAPATGWPTQFEYRGQAPEAERVERYYETSYNLLGGEIIGTLSSNGFVQLRGSAAALLGYSTRFRTQKRIAPTVSVYSVNTGTVAKIRDISTGADLTSVQASVGVNGYTENAVITNANDVVAWHYVADARL